MPLDYLPYLEVAPTQLFHLQIDLLQRASCFAVVEDVAQRVGLATFLAQPLSATGRCAQELEKGFV